MMGDIINLLYPKKNKTLDLKRSRKKEKKNS